MQPVDKLELYLRAQLAALRAHEQPPPAPAEHPFVTISRQAGAGGHSLANALLRTFEDDADTSRFGHWHIFDQRLCEMVAADEQYAGSLESLMAEEYRSPTSDLFHQVLRATLDQDLVMARVFQVVRAVASIGKAIIVGRAGSHVTKDMAPGVHLRIVAPEPDRTARLRELKELSERQARSEMRRLDAGRARLLRSHFGADIDDPTGYDAVWNSGSASLDEIAAATLELVRRRCDAWQRA